jgi:hypothetical protein
MTPDEIGGTQSELRHAPGALGLDQDVGALEQPRELLALGGSLEIESETELVEVAMGEVEAPALVEGWQHAGACPRRRLDPNHLRTEVGEQTARELALFVGEIEDTDTGEGQFVRHRS